MIFNASSFYASGAVYQIFVKANKTYNRTGFNKLELEVSNFSAPLPDVTIQ